MKILIVSQVFWPENFKINDFCSDLIRRGHDVTILTGKPNYPKGKFYDGYSFFSNNNDFFEGAKIIRVPIISRGDGSAIRLSLNYLSNLSQTLPVVPLPIKGSNTNSNSLDV